VTKRKKIIRYIQLTLFFLSLILIYFTYYYEKTPTGQISLQEENQNQKKNTFENVEYTGVDLNGNRFIIKSQNAEFELNTPELINMKIMNATFYFKDGKVLNIYGDYGNYNNKTFDIEFRDNIRADYEKDLLFADNLDYFNSKGLLLIYGNVESLGEKGELTADKLIFDLKKETLDISMFDNAQIDVKLKR
tara:strand:+ start:1519 stop:2091 length:573 start_codon:yes stop_codon:yes gene_type:complete